MSTFRTILIHFVFCCISSHLQAQTPAAFCPTCSKKERKAEESKLKNEIESTLKTPWDAASEKQWLRACWAMELMQLRSNTKYASLIRSNAVAPYTSLSQEGKRQLLECLITLYPTEFADEVMAWLPQETDPKLLAMQAHYLFKTIYVEQAKSKVRIRIAELGQDEHPILYSLYNDLVRSRAMRLAGQPPIFDWLAHIFPRKLPVIYSFQRLNRDYPGLCVVRMGDGKFLENADTLFYVPQFARSMSNLPGYLTNGNTPTGLLSVRKITTSKDPYIGPTPVLEMFLPFETDNESFYFQPLQEKKPEVLYEFAIPESWRNYLPIWEAYYAGKAGRTEIFAHGTTINPNFYQGTRFFPNTPSLGCLTAAESWSEEDGSRLQSEQNKLIKALESIGFTQGFLVVIEMDDSPRPVTLEEVKYLVDQTKQ
jgi:hypothetical protein